MTAPYVVERPDALAQLRDLLAVDASDAGLGVGRWPASIEVDGTRYDAWRPVDVNGEQAGVRYRSSDGRIVTIWND